MYVLLMTFKSLLNDQMLNRKRKYDDICAVLDFVLFETARSVVEVCETINSPRPNFNFTLCFSIQT